MDRECSFSVASAAAGRNHPQNLPCQCFATTILFRWRPHRWNVNSEVESGNAIETMFLRLTKAYRTWKFFMQETLPLSRIVQGKNPREYFDPQEMAELEEGIRAYGVLQAILVRPIEGSDLVEIVAGERRWRAAKNVFGDDYDMPVKILDVSDTDADAIAVIENFHRADVLPCSADRGLGAFASFPDRIRAGASLRWQWRDCRHGGRS